MVEDQARGAAEAARRAARESYGRLIAILVVASRDLPAAEDALADAFERALRTWAESGVPENPDAWLLSVARNRLRDGLRSAAARTAIPLERVVENMGDQSLESGRDMESIPDRRLELLFACAHPAIDRAIRTPLMLQVVLGIDVSTIARAFAVPTATLAQRLVRAKRKMKDARIPFVLPDRSDMPERLDAVLEAVYGSYAVNWQFVSGETLALSLSGEALHLGVLIAQLLPDEPEALGLAAVLCFSVSRLDARIVDGRFVPLEEQDTTLWDAELIRRGESYLNRAAAADRMGRFQLEAAIESAHCERTKTGKVDADALSVLLTALVALTPTLGAQVACAAVAADTEGPAAALAQLDAIADSGRFQPAWALRARLYERLGRRADARRAYDKAISLTTEPPLRAYLVERAARVS